MTTLAAAAPPSVAVAGLAASSTLCRASPHTARVATTSSWPRCTAAPWPPPAPPPTAGLWARRWRSVTVRAWWTQWLLERPFDSDDEEGSSEDDESEGEDEDDSGKAAASRGPGEGGRRQERVQRAQARSVQGEQQDVDDVDDLVADDRRWADWQRRRAAIDELREFQATGRDPDDPSWEDWLDEGWDSPERYKDGPIGAAGWYVPQPDWEKGGVPRDTPKLPERGMSRTVKELLLRILEPQAEVEDDLAFEEKVFRYTSQSTAKFAALLVIIPVLSDIVMHDYVLVPFFERWSETTPMGAKLLDVRERQRLDMVHRLKLERQRVRFEADIGKTPPLSDDDLAEHMHIEAVELREDIRRENRIGFANIWSDAVAFLTALLLVVFNPKQIALMRLTGDRIFTNISDTGKAFIIILCTDIFLGYHSESGWETVIELFLDHYGLQASQGSVYLFIATVPVTIDAIFKLWVFRYLTRLSPSAAATFREMKRH